jgi:Xaa-Pro aminopeptidase
MPAPFERAEYAARLRKTREAMRAAGLDVLLVFHQEHMFYLAAYDQIGYWVYQVLIVPAADAPRARALPIPQHAVGLRQRITTEFLGIDGISYTPLSPANYRV